MKRVRELVSAGCKLSGANARAWAENHRHITEELRSRYLYIMVDEFQDTNDLQWKIVGAIASDGKSKLFGSRLN